METNGKKTDAAIVRSRLSGGVWRCTRKEREKAQPKKGCILSLCNSLHLWMKHPSLYRVAVMTTFLSSLGQTYIPEKYSKTTGNQVTVGQVNVRINMKE